MGRKERLGFDCSTTTRKWSLELSEFVQESFGWLTNGR
uniref:Uncharacterized protein n=1 Tax=Arundo donax TaxID=35708 RepID=A0A0A9FVR8_ARUDO